MASPVVSAHELSSEEQNLIAKRTANGDFRAADFKLTPVSNAVGNLGKYFRIEMTLFEEDPQQKPKVYRFFMKAKPAESGWQTELMRKSQLFEKEVLFYNDMSGVFRKLISADVYPESLLAVEDKIVMADMYTLGYRPIADITPAMDFEHAKQCILALARFHSASIIYEEQTGRPCSEHFPESIKETVYAIGFKGIPFLESGGRAAAAFAPYHTKYKNDADAVSAIRENVVISMLKLENYFAEDVAFRKAICNGDSWPANFLFKYDDNGTLQSAILVDFQMTRYRPPACEFMVFLYLSLSMSDMKNWREILMDVYYETVAQEITNAGLVADSVYSRDEFRRSCIYYQMVGVIYALLFFPFSRVSQDKMAEVVRDKETGERFYYKDRNDHVLESCRNDPAMRDFFEGAIEELYENFIKTRRGHTEFTP